MKKLLMVVCAAAMTLGLVQVVGAASKDEIASRIQKVGSVCVEGEDCASGTAGATAVASSGMKPPADIYNQACATCHAIGVAGAPKLGDVAAWEPRIAKGMDTLYASVINGLPPGMPAKGMCFTCSDDELRSVTDYMVAEAQ